MGAPVRFQKAVPRTKEKRRSGAPKGAPVRIMDRQFPPAGGTGPIVRRANGCGVPRPRISALRFPLLGPRRVRMTIWHDSPPGCAARQRSRTPRQTHGGTTMAKLKTQPPRRGVAPMPPVVLAPMTQGATPRFWQNEPEVFVLY